MSDDKCPLCGCNQLTSYSECWSDGDEIVKLPKHRQDCAGCRLPYRYWKRINDKIAETRQDMIDID